MIHFPEKTAISRSKPAKPMRILFEQNRLTGKMLDFGCGKGKDADFFKMAKYDPFYFPETLENSYDTITCQYVLNVLPIEQEKEVLLRIKYLLKEKGMAYITVRRDLTKEGLTRKKTYQRNVFLDLPIFYEEKFSFCIYQMTK
jgi:2-polyprenyl-3-methyl-5-hydroxy-6-metoxy-1,4-benzoquinol methylase